MQEGGACQGYGWRVHEESIEECGKLVSRVINNLPNAGITKLREIVRTGARQHHLLNPFTFRQKNYFANTKAHPNSTSCSKM
uniref:Uncharacterized protein n=1 Tax=Ditylenchus dipsaci TaxID=166011 RepID=A0A915D543_9BILA